MSVGAGGVVDSGVAESDVGVRVDRFRLARRIGAGGMGEVWAAHDPDLDREVAVKLVRGEADRLVGEARAMARLAHPNVVTVFDAGVHDDGAWIAMELVDGGNLRAWMKAGPPVRDVVAVFAAAGRGLAAAHRAGIVHRDFKPDNVMLGRDGRVRVGDFGLAVGDAGDDAAAVAGTPAYMAPEQQLGRAVDARADQFAFCVSMWEALGGERPFVPESSVGMPTALGVGLAIIDDARGPHPPRAPRWLRQVLDRGLAADRDARYPSMDALVDALEHGLGRRRRFAIAAAAGGGAAALVAAIALWPRAAAAPAAAPDAMPPGLADLEAARPLTAYGAAACARAPAFADADTIVFEQLARDAVDLYRVDAAGGAPAQLTSGKTWEERAQPGRHAGEVVHLVTDNVDGTGSALAALDVETGASTTLLTTTARGVAAIDDDLYYAAGTTLHRIRAARDQVVINATADAEVNDLVASPRGDRIAYLGFDAAGDVRHVCVVDLATAVARCRPEPVRGRPAFGADGAALYVPTEEGIVRLVLDQDEPPSLVVPGARAGGGVAIARDGATLQLAAQDAQPAAQVVVHLAAARAHAHQRVLPHPDRDAEEIQLVEVPAPALARLAGEQVRPAAVRKVVLRAAVMKHRRDQQAVAEHVLAVERATRRIVRELEQHRAQHGLARLAGLHRGSEQVRHEPALEVREMAQHVTRFLVVQPGYAIGRAAVQAAVRREQPERDPSLVDGGAGLALEAPDVMAPEAEAAQAEAEPAAQRLRHRLVVAVAVAAPVHGEALAGGGRRACEDAGVPLAALLLQEFEHRLVVKVRVVVVHQRRV